MGKTEILVLGPVQVWASGHRIRLDSAITEALLAALVNDADKLVTLDALIDVGWEANPPATVRRQLRNRLAGLRRMLLDAGFPADVLGIDDNSYILRSGEIRLDLKEFDHLQRLVLESPDEQAAIALSRKALALWRGPAFAGLESSRLLAIGDQLAEQRLTLLEHCLTLEVELGHHENAVAELVGLNRLNPVRERLAGLLMLALYRSGRQADALEVFAATRTYLANELGLSPGAELRTVHEQILREDPRLNDRVIRRKPIKHAPQAVPRQLPRDTPHFHGRAESLAQLDEWLLANNDHASAPVVISAIDGMGGVGKTALAVHWAHKVREQFPDGQLYVNMRGFDPTGAVMAPAEAVRRFLDALAVPPQRIPIDLDGQVNLYRTVLANKRLLIVLDNARDPDQVRPLLPGSPGCHVLITSRNRLTSLVAADGAHALPLDLLTQAEARDLLIGRLGHARVTADPDSVDEIISHCSRLPLALAIVAAHASDPRRPLKFLAAQLRDSRDRLDVLATGDAAITDVRAVFSWSYQKLAENSARLFRLLGLHPGPDISLAAAASLAGVPADEAYVLLAELTNAHLVEERMPGRYSLHDLLHAYAAELVDSTIPGDQRHEATNRLLDYYLHTAFAGAQLMTPERALISLGNLRLGACPELLPNYDKGLQWFVTERQVLFAMISHAAANAFDTHVVQLTWAVVPFLDLQAHWQDQAALHHHAIAASERLGDVAAQTFAHRNLGRVLTRQGDLAGAETQLLRALGLADETGDVNALGSIYLNLGHVREQQGRYLQALDASKNASDLFVSAGYPFGRAVALSAVGWCLAKLGDYQQALVHCHEALALQREIGNRYIQANTLDTLGYLHLQLGDHDQAVARYKQAIKLTEDVGAEHKTAAYLNHLGDAHLAAQDSDAALQAWEQALAVFDELDHPDADEVRSKLSNLRNNRRPTADPSKERLASPLTVKPM